MLNSDFENFQIGLLVSPRCSGCRRRCNIVYDAHHDQYFSSVCGTVVMEMGVFCVPVVDDLELLFEKYEERWAKSRK